jgi:hypothetical protein
MPTNLAWRYIIRHQAQTGLAELGFSFLTYCTGKPNAFHVCYGLDMICAPEAHALAWFPAGGTIEKCMDHGKLWLHHWVNPLWTHNFMVLWRGSGNFQRWDLVRGSKSLWVCSRGGYLAFGLSLSLLFGYHEVNSFLCHRLLWPWYYHHDV